MPGRQPSRCRSTGWSSIPPDPGASWKAAASRARQRRGRLPGGAARSRRAAPRRCAPVLPCAGHRIAVPRRLQWPCPCSRRRMDRCRKPAVEAAAPGRSLRRRAIPGPPAWVLRSSAGPPGDRAGSVSIHTGCIRPPRPSQDRGDIAAIAPASGSARWSGPRPGRSQPPPASRRSLLGVRYPGLPPCGRGRCVARQPDGISRVTSRAGSSRRRPRKRG